MMTTTMETLLESVTPVPTATMIGLYFSLCIAFGLPIFLAIFVRRKLKSKVWPVLLGAAVFLVFAMVLEQAIHMLVLRNDFGTKIMSSPVLYGLYGGLMAALFEEGGRYIAMRYVMRGSLNKENAIMYGVGHGGIEAILIVGLSYFSNIAVAAMVNNGDIAQFFAGMDEATAQTMFQQIAPLWQGPAYVFYMAGIEGIGAVAVHICLSYLVYRAIDDVDWAFFALAFGAHFAVDFIASVLSQSGVSMIVIELIVLALAAALVVMVRRFWKQEVEYEKHLKAQE